MMKKVKKFPDTSFVHSIKYVNGSFYCLAENLVYVLDQDSFEVKNRIRKILHGHFMLLTPDKEHLLIFDTTNHYYLVDLKDEKIVYKKRIPISDKDGYAWIRGEEDVYFIDETHVLVFSMIGIYIIDLQKRSFTDLTKKLGFQNDLEQNNQLKGRLPIGRYGYYKDGKICLLLFEGKRPNYRLIKSVFNIQKLEAVENVEYHKIYSKAYELYVLFFTSDCIIMQTFDKLNRMRFIQISDQQKSAEQIISLPKKMQSLMQSPWPFCGVHPVCKRNVAFVDDTKACFYNIESQSFTVLEELLHQKYSFGCLSTVAMNEKIYILYANSLYIWDLGEDDKYPLDSWF